MPVLTGTATSAAACTLHSAFSEASNLGLLLPAICLPSLGICCRLYYSGLQNDSRLWKKLVQLG